MLFMKRVLCEIQGNGNDTVKPVLRTAVANMIDRGIHSLFTFTFFVREKTEGTEAVNAGRLEIGSQPYVFNAINDRSFKREFFILFSTPASFSKNVRLCLKAPADRFRRPQDRSR